MRSDIPGFKRAESIISLSLLAVLTLVVTGVFIKQFDYDMSRFGISRQGQLPADLLTAGEQVDLSAVVPQGFDVFGPIEIYGSENLFEKINGKAPFYTEAGFDRLFSRRFLSEIDENLWFEVFVYRMAGAKAAFSVYSRQKRAEAKPVSFPFSPYVYQTGSGLYFCQGNYYVELVGSEESDKLLEAITQAAGRICRRLVADEPEEITQLSLFPSEGLVDSSIKLYPAGAFGSDELTDTFTAQYEIEGQVITVFLSEREDSKQADLTAESYRKFLIDNGAVVKETDAEEFEGRVFDFYGTVEIVLSVGRFVAGVHEAESQRNGQRLAGILVKRLGRESD